MNTHSTEAQATFARARAALVLRASGDTEIDRWLGWTSGEHIFRMKDGRVRGVDLVLCRATIYVGTLPHQWAHPPRVNP